MRINGADFAKQDMIRLCHSALDSRTLRVELLKRVQAIIPFDYVYFSTTDPATQLITNSVMLEEPPAWLMSVFLENEFLQQDFSKFSHMFRNRQTVNILSQATRDEPNQSSRYREMLLPLGMEDELRAIFASDGACWGTLCLHRGKSKSGYTRAEADFLTQLAPHIADGLRKAVLLEKVFQEYAPASPGVLLVTDDFSIMAMNDSAEYWLREITEIEKGNQKALPLAVRSVISALKALESGMIANTIPKIRICTQAGHWLTLHASRLKSKENSSQITVLFELAQPSEIAPLIMQAYMLTKRESEITQCVLYGWSTHDISTNLHISSNTVQDHLKAIFEKVDVRSRGELVARIFTRHYQS